MTSFLPCFELLINQTKCIDFWNKYASKTKTEKTLLIWMFELCNRNLPKLCLFKIGFYILTLKVSLSHFSLRDKYQSENSILKPWLIFTQQDDKKREETFKLVNNINRKLFKHTPCWSLLKFCNSYFEESSSTNLIFVLV